MVFNENMERIIWAITLQTPALLKTLLISIFLSYVFSIVLPSLCIHFEFKGGLIEAFKNQKTKFLVISFSSDWLYTTKENKETVIALNAAGADVSFAEIKTDKGHDSFLVNEPEFLKTIKGFIDSMHIKFKNEKRI